MILTKEQKKDLIIGKYIYYLEKLDLNCKDSIFEQIITNTKNASLLVEFAKEVEKLMNDKNNKIFYGIYNDIEMVVAIHETKEGAEKNKENYIKQYGGNFRIDLVTIHK